MPPKRKATDDLAKDGKAKKAATHSTQGLQNDPAAPVPLATRPAPPKSLSASHPAICRRLKESQARNPRFLFRTWSAKSGGRLGLNTKEAITPLAFFLEPNQLPFWHQSPEMIAQNSYSHLEGYTFEGLRKDSFAERRPFHSFFSSWSQSLTEALTFATGAAFDTPHLGVIDTHALSESNVVLYTPEMRFIDGRIPSEFINEFLVYGVVSGPAYRAVAFKDLGKTYLTHLRTLPLRESIRLAQEIGSKFGEHFELPMAAYLLATHERLLPDMQEIVSKLAENQVPEDWAQDITIMYHNAVHTGGFAVVKTAMEILRNLVPASLQARTKELEDRVAELEIRNAPDSGYDAQDATRDAERVEGVMRGLYIDMIGWKPEDQAKWEQTDDATV